MTDLRPIVLVIDDDPSVREALGSLIRSAHLDVALFGSIDQFLEAPLPDRPSCLLLDVRLPGRCGLDFHCDLARSNPDLPVIIITGHGDIPMSVRAMKAGAVEFLTKPFCETSLLDAISLALARHHERRSEGRELAELKARYASMSPREQEVMRRVVKGGPNKQIAAEFNLSEITIKVHRGQVMRKMQAHSLVALIRMADKLGVSAAGGDLLVPASARPAGKSARGRDADRRGDRLATA